MARALSLALAFMMASAVVQANQCSGGGECPSDNDTQSLSLLQIQLGMNIAEARSRQLTAGAATQPLQGAATPAMPWTAEVDKVTTLAASLSTKTDKFTDHAYQTMYGIFLGPLGKAGGKAKLLEIGLGCDMRYGPGASVKMWQALLPNVELWEADIDGACVQHARSRGQLDGVNTVSGDQGDKALLAQWVAQSGGNFDVIIDDGGHLNTQIKASFDVLWPAVKRGGLYFLEDLQVGRSSHYDTTGGSMVMSDIVQDWVEQLLIRENAQALGHSLHPKDSALKWPLPVGVEFVMCQKQACVIGKSPAKADKDSNTP